MPILPAEESLFPADLLVADGVDSPWWAIYTLSRQEKQLMRKLREAELPFYCPMIARRYRSPAGRLRVSHSPLFPNYVFLCGDNDARYRAVCTGHVSRCLEVDDVPQLVRDLRQLHDLIATGAPLAPESRIEPGDRVRIRNGQFAGFEGLIVRRQQETRLVIDVKFMNQGASVLLEDCQVELLEPATVRGEP
jgi:transcriptional antiterminator RfaH